MSDVVSILGIGGTEDTSSSVTTDDTSTGTLTSSLAITASTSKASSTSSSTSISSTLTSSSSTSPSSSSSATDTSSSSATSSLSTSTFSSTTPLSTSSSPTTTSTSSSDSSLSTSIHLTTESDNGATHTVTVVNTPSTSASPSSTASTSGDSSFWSNKGAVAGTFTVVALAGFALLVWAIIFIIRWRRQRKYDRESEEAAAEAANATAPVFLDVDDDDRPTTYRNYLDTNGYGYGYGRGYDAYNSVSAPSASSHGTYAQPPMGLSNGDRYPMAEFGSSQYPGNSPYPVFMTSGQAPQHNSYHDYGYLEPEHNQSSPPRQATRPTSGAYSAHNLDLIDGGAADMAYANGVSSLAAHSTSQSQPDLQRSKSQGARSLVDGYHDTTATSSSGHDFIAPPTTESYAAHYQSGYTTSAAHSRRSTILSSEDQPAVPPLPNSATGQATGFLDEDEENNEEVPQRTMLKVTNE